MQKRFLSSRVTAPSRHPLNFSNFEVSHGNASTPDALDFIVCAVCWFNLFGFVKARGNPEIRAAPLTGRQTSTSPVMPQALRRADQSRLSASRLLFSCNGNSACRFAVRADFSAVMDAAEVNPQVLLLAFAAGSKLFDWLQVLPKAANSGRQ